MSGETRGDQQLTHSQEPIATAQRLYPESPLYNMAFAFVFPGTLRQDWFCSAWEAVAGASDVLRTRIAEPEAGALRAAIAPRAAPTRVLEPAAGTRSAEEFRRWCRARCARPLPLGGDLTDSVLVPLADGTTGWYLNQHHLIADARSMQLLYRQVEAAYRGLSERREGLPAPPPYYPTAAAALAATQRLDDGARQSASSHWQARREGSGRRMPLYGLACEPAGTESIRRSIRLSEQETAALGELGRQPGFVSLSAELSRFAVLATLLAAWLHRVSGRSEVGFDAPVAGRPTAAAKRSLGPFIEMFPFATSVRSGDTFRSLGARCLEEAIGFLRHALPGSGAPSGRTSANVVLNYIPEAFGAFAGLRPEIEWVHPGHGDSVHTLRLQAHDFEGSGRLTLHLDLQSEALPRALGERSVEHFRSVLTSLLEDPDQPIAKVEVLAGDERDELATLARPRRPAARPAADRLVLPRLLARAGSEPDRVVLRQEGREVRYAELQRQSEALAAELGRRGVAIGDRVAIVGRRSIEVVAAILGTLRARAAYIPIDPGNPPSRLSAILEDADPALVLTAGEVALPAASGCDRVAIEDALHHGSGDRHPLPRVDDIDSSEPAYLIYTSGSTGQPKAVVIDHGGLATYLSWAERKYVRGDRLTFPLFTSLAFDLTVTSLLLPLLTGGTLEIYPETEGTADTAWMDVVRADRADFIKLTPSHLELLAGIGLAGSRIRRMVVGGEALRTRLAATVSAQIGEGLDLYNEYGPTEAVVGCIVHRFDPPADRGPDVPIGRPADHVGVEILGSNGVPVPVGVPGELWLSGSALAAGYHRRPQLTADSFRPLLDCSAEGAADSSTEGRRRYRTGDLVRLSEGGDLEFLGRRDRQLKVSGFRIEPGEVEAALLTTPGIEQGVALARTGPAEPAAIRDELCCVRCGLPASYPQATFDEAGVCSVCRAYETSRDEAEAYFLGMDDLQAVFTDARAAATAGGTAGEYDCMMLYSGGKDSTYALCRLAEMGLRVYAFTLDNGFISDSAKENIRKVAAQLGVKVELATTPAMNAIFRDSLRRFSNVCNGCFKTIYTLAMQRARELGIPVVVTGLSRGQMFETRLSEELFRGGRRSPEEIDAAVLAARKLYHRLDDEVSRSLDVRAFADDRIFEEVRVVDFYRYCDVELDEMLSYLRTKVPWVRPEDTGRSTNCLINDAGIFIHRREKGFHNYALPYSWDVRLGHKEREAALDELDDDIDPAYVRRTLVEIGFDPTEAAATTSPGGAESSVLEAFYVAGDPIDEAELRRELARRLPVHMIPAVLRPVDRIPLTASGKVDEDALRRAGQAERRSRPYRAPDGPVEEFLVAVWQNELGLPQVGADDHFFELGGTSATAIQVILHVCREFDLDLPLDGLFEHPTLTGLAQLAEERILAEAELLDSQPAPEPGTSPGA